MFKFITKLFKKQSKHPIKTELIGKDKNEIIVNVTLDVSKKSLEIVEKEGMQEFENRWSFEETEIDYYTDDGTPIHKSLWTTNAERKEVEFLGRKKYSKNKKYCIVGVEANDYKYNIALVDTDNKTILFKKKFNNPSIYAVSNNGKIAFVERFPKSYKVNILDTQGNIILEKRHNQFISHFPFEFSEDDLNFIYELHTSHKMIRINL